MARSWSLRCRVFQYVLDQAGSTTRDQAIQIAIHFHEFASQFAGRIRDQLQRFLGEAGVREAGLQCGHDGFVGFQGLFSTAQDDSIPGFKAKSTRIRRDVWARFVNDSDNAKRNTLLAYRQTIG